MPRRLELSSTYTRLLLSSGAVAPEKLLQGTELTQERLQALEFVPERDAQQVFANYDRYSSDPAWTAKLGAQLNLSAHGPLGFAALSAPTLGEALDVLAELLPTRNTASVARTRVTQDRYCFEVFDAMGEARFHQWLAEVVFKIVELLLASILGHPVSRNVVIHLARPAPAHARELAACYDAEVRFDQPVDAITVPLAWRQLPSPLHDEGVYRANLITCRELIAAREQAGSLALAVRNHLRNHFDSQGLRDAVPGPPPTLETMAETLHMAPRTLIRRLQREDSTYKAILEELRREYAFRLLQDARLTAADVGTVLGYAEAANFGRAFRRWTGQSPAAWRRSGDQERPAPPIRAS